MIGESLPITFAKVSARTSRMCVSMREKVGPSAAGVSNDVFESPADIVFEAENRLHTINAEPVNALSDGR